METLNCSGVLGTDILKCKTFEILVRVRIELGLYPFTMQSLSMAVPIPGNIKLFLNLFAGVSTQAQTKSTRAKEVGIGC